MTTSSPGITVRPTTPATTMVVKTSSNNPQLLLNNNKSTTNNNNTSTAKFLKYVNSDGKMFIVPMSTITQQNRNFQQTSNGNNTNSVRLVIARKTTVPPTTGGFINKGIIHHNSPLINAKRVDDVKK